MVGTTPWNDPGYNESYTYCRVTRQCKSDDPHDADIAGVGVFASFLATTTITLSTIVLAYFFDCLPITDDRLNYIDALVVEEVQKIMGPALKYVGWSSFLKKSENHQKFRTVWSAGVEPLILGLGDQQLVTGIAILFAVYLRVCSISVYGFQTASTLAWFSSTTHLATITILPRYLDKHKPVRNIRAFLMILYAILLASAQILSYSESLTGSAWNSYLGCVLTTEFRMSPSLVIDSLSLSILIVWLAFSYFDRFTYLYTKPENRSPTRSWMYTTFARKRGLEIKKALESDEAATLADIESLDEGCGLLK